MGIDLPRDIGTRRLPFARLARFITHLGPDSAVFRLREALRLEGGGRMQITPELALLHRIELWTHMAYWSKTKDASKNANRPKPVDLERSQKAIRSDKPNDARALEARLLERQAARAAELARIAVAGIPGGTVAEEGEHGG